MRLVAMWSFDQDPKTEEPAAVRWQDGSKATMADFRRMRHLPELNRDGIPFSFERWPIPAGENTCPNCGERLRLVTTNRDGVYSGAVVKTCIKCKRLVLG